MVLFNIYFFNFFKISFLAFYAVLCVRCDNKIIINIQVLVLVLVFVLGIRVLTTSHHYFIRVRMSSFYVLFNTEFTTAQNDDLSHHNITCN